MRAKFSWLALRKNRSDVGHTPGPAEVQAVQVDDLGVMAVGDGGGGEEPWRSLLGDLREEAVKPAVKLCRPQNPGHEVRLHEGWGEEVLPTRLPHCRVEGVGEVVLLASSDDELLNPLSPQERA